MKRFHCTLMIGSRRQTKAREPQAAARVRVSKIPVSDSPVKVSLELFSLQTGE